MSSSGSAPSSSSNSKSRRQLAKFWGIAPAKVSAMVRMGILDAINVGFGGRVQFRFTPDAIKAAEERLAVGPAPKRRKRAGAVDPEIENMLR